MLETNAILLNSAIENEWNKLIWTMTYKCTTYMNNTEPQCWRHNDDYVREVL